MLSFPLITLALATIGTYAKPTARGLGSLEVSLSTPADKVTSVSDLKVVASVTNRGSEGAKILKYGTVLDNELPTRSFTVSKDGKETPFIGISVSLAYDHLSETDWIEIPAGKTITAEHNVSALYDFSASGPGTFTFDPIPRFRLIKTDGSVEVVPAASRPIPSPINSVSITITDDVSKRELSLEKRAINECSDPYQDAFLIASRRESLAMAKNAAEYIDERGATDPLYKAYFGSNANYPISNYFKAIWRESSKTRIMGCSDPLGQCGTTGSVAAYTYPGTNGEQNTYFCPVFFNQRGPEWLCNGGSVDSRDLRGGTVLHELSRSMANAVDIEVKCPESQKLPDQYSIQNAANYQCFAAQLWANECKR